MRTHSTERLVAILKRELGAREVSFAHAPQLPAETDVLFLCPVPHGPSVVVEFGEPPEDPEATERRMRMIVGAFTDVLVEAPNEGARRRPSPARSLASELDALCERAGALHALVVDARSPVVWGISEGPEAPEGAGEPELTRLFRRAAHAGLRLGPFLSLPLLEISASEAVDVESGDPAKTGENHPPGSDLTPAERAEFWRRFVLVRNALSAVRALPQVANLHRGEHLHDIVRSPELSYLVRSFATIYMLVLVFEGPFDELRAERCMVHALPTIERLVLALPPSEPPDPVAGARAVRGRRR